MEEKNLTEKTTQDIRRRQAGTGYVKGLVDRLEQTQDLTDEELETLIFFEEETEDGQEQAPGMIAEPSDPAAAKSAKDQLYQPSGRELYVPFRDPGSLQRGRRTGGYRSGTKRIQMA